MQGLGLERDIIDEAAYARTVARFREMRIVLPTFAEMADPDRIPPHVAAAVAAVEPDAPSPLNLFRCHWHDGPDRRSVVEVPEHVVLPKSLTGVDAKIAVALGDRFPMIASHKVLAAYACLAPRVVTGQFDPTRDRAVWPSTGNYCRGGVAISRIMGCRGVAVLPEGMSRARFEWLERWVADPEDIIRTPGTESNVKEIYDRCAILARDPENAIFNQFAEYPNHLVHRLVTGPALERVFRSMRAMEPGLRLAAFVSATGSAGTIGAGSHLRELFGTRIVAVEALECPTLLRNGYGEHNIQGIGDKHVPLIHDVMRTDLVVDVSDRATDRLDVLFGTRVGKEHLARRRGVPETVIGHLRSFGLSSICNVLAAIKTAKHLGLGPEDVIVTVATDGAGMYDAEREHAERRFFPSGFDAVAAGEVFGEHVLGMGTDDMLELTTEDRERIFNLGYYTWVEQQGIPLADFDARRSPDFWDDLLDLVPAWDAMIEELNAATGVRIGA